MPQNFLALVKEKAREHPARIVFPETFDERTLRAVAGIIEEKTAHPVLIGNPQELAESFKKMGLAADLSAYTVIDMKGDQEGKTRYTDALFELRKNKGMTKEQAQKLMDDLNYFGVMVVQMGAEWRLWRLYWSK